MPYEDSLPLLASLLLLASILFWIWRSSGQNQWVIAALLTFAVSCGVAAIDFFSQTGSARQFLNKPRGQEVAILNSDVVYNLSK